MARRERVRTLVLGGGPAGTFAAQELRKADPEGSIRIVGAEPHRLYNRTLLSKDLLLGADQARAWLKEPSFYERRRIELVAGCRVVSVDAGARTATLDDGSLQPWERLLVATGADPVRPDLEGTRAEGVCVLRSLADAAEIRERAGGARGAVCVGGGFIGVETACALRELGLDVHLVMLEARLWPALLPPPVAAVLEARLRRDGVRVLAGRALEGFRVDRGTVRAVRLSGGFEAAASLVVLGLGVRPAIAFLRGAGIPLGRGVLTGPTLETPVPGVFAAGDVAEVAPAGGGSPRLVGHWANALAQGRLAGANLAGTTQVAFDDVPFFDTRVFDLEVAFLGEPRADLPFALQGSLEERRFIAFFLERERLIGAVHVNRTADVPAVLRLLRERRRVDRAALAGLSPDELTDLDPVEAP